MSDLRGGGPLDKVPGWVQERKGPLALLLVAVVAVLLWLWYDSAVLEPQREAEAARRVEQLVEAASPHEVVYEVEGTATFASVTMETPTGTEQADVSLPMTNKSGSTGVQLSFSPGEFVYISAQNVGETGTVTCRITVDGSVVSENTSTAGFGIASCEGSA